MADTSVALGFDFYSQDELEEAWDALSNVGIVRVRHCGSLRNTLCGRLETSSFKSFEMFDTRSGRNEWCYVIMTHRYIKRLLNLMGE